MSGQEWVGKMQPNGTWSGIGEWFQSPSGNPPLTPGADPGFLDRSGPNGNFHRTGTMEKEGGREGCRIGKNLFT